MLVLFATTLLTAVLVLLACRLRGQARRRADGLELDRLRAALRGAVREAEELAALDRAKSRALLNVVNGMRTPLTLLAGPEAGTSAAAARSVERLRGSVDALGGLLGFELGDRDLRRVRVDVVDWLRRQVDAVRPAAERHGLTVDVSAELPELRAAVDPDKLGRLFTALVERVFEQAERGDQLRVVLGAEPDGPLGAPALRIDLHDTAQPLSDGYRRILCGEPDWTRDERMLRDRTGLSLALAGRFARLHGGAVEVDADGPFGTRVRVILPCGEAGHADAAAPSSDGQATRHADFGLDVVPAGDSAVAAAEPALPDGPAAAEGTPPPTTVLVVDDHEGTRGYLSLALRRHHRVLQASDGEEGLALVREHRPDLVLCDVMMPRMDGHTFCRVVKEDPELNHIPVFLITANVQPGIKREGLASGADDYLFKPFDVEEALMRVNNAIRQRRELRRRFSREVVVKPSDIVVDSVAEVFLDEARQAVERHMADEDFGVNQLADELNMSPRQLHRKLRETVDQSPVVFIRALRMQRAAQLIEGDFGNVSEVAYAVGFKSLSYFAKCFREAHGCAPSEYHRDESVLPE